MAKYTMHHLVNSVLNILHNDCKTINMQQLFTNLVPLPFFKKKNYQFFCPTGSRN